MKKLLLLFSMITFVGLLQSQAQSCIYAKKYSCTKKTDSKVAYDHDGYDLESEAQLVSSQEEAYKKTCKKSKTQCSKYKNMSAKMVSNTTKPAPSLAAKAACLQACAKTKAAKAKIQYAKLDGV